MAATALTGPQFIFANLDGIPAMVAGGPIPAHNGEVGPNGEYQGSGLLDPRFIYPKDKVTGFTGVVAASFHSPTMFGTTAIPAALAANNIAAAQNVVSGTAMALAAASVGVSVNIPIRPFSSAVNGSAVSTAALVLDFGFAFGNCTSGSTSIPVGNGADFFIGMPLVIAGVGNAGGTAPLFTICTAVAANTITVANAPAATNAAAAIGLGDLWGPSELGFPTPQAHLPYIGSGAGLWLDPRQAIARGVRVVGVGGSSGGTFTVRGWDVYWQPMTETITVAAGASTGYGKKAWKAIGSVTPNFTNAFNYTVGTTDVFGCNFRSPLWEQTTVDWAAASMVTNQGWVAPDATTPATATTGDVRGTIQTGASGGGTGIGATASNGTVGSLLMTGNRLSIATLIPINQAALATASNPVPLYGVTQV